MYRRRVCVVRMARRALRVDVCEISADDGSLMYTTRLSSASQAVDFFRLVHSTAASVACTYLFVKESSKGITV